MSENTGEGFLKTKQGQSLVIAPKALEKLAAFTGFPATRAVAMAMFRRAYRVRSCEMWPMGTWKQDANGVKRRWYFRFRVFSQELIAVVCEGDDPKVLEWTATYQFAGAEAQHARGPLEPTAA